MSIDRELIEQAMSYEAYLTLIDELLQEGKSTSGDRKESNLAYTRLNQQRTKKWDKIININEPLTQALSTLSYDIIWLVLTEGWCGDAAQNLPIINKMAMISPQIDLKLLLRDQHPQLMDAYLTKGARAIPKLIFLRKSDLKELAVWGPRPSPAQNMLYDYKKNGSDPTIDIYQEIHLWYSKNKAEALQEEFLSLVKNLP
ncbi:thioredoxin family protein [Fulvivirgaceae bacterium BMA12]|uniref:Thioredoxin family protein n=1 Tax=Agaribacillus aureus TaxID=3051825 RepID=A0ABT8LI24_9BACT|nr:thioredoxin family protein [Fulvivirgaceae bacterium BMA12]